MSTSRRGKRVLLVSGSARNGSTNTAALRTAAEVAPRHVATTLFEGIGELPLFNPDSDVDGEDVDPRVASLRLHVALSDAILICTPEYAGTLPAALKNLLEWTVGDGGTYRKPVAWINVQGQRRRRHGADAHDCLRRVLTYVSADVVERACLRVPLTRQLVEAGIVSSGPERALIAKAMRRLVEHLDQGAESTGSTPDQQEWTWAAGQEGLRRQVRDVQRSGRHLGPRHVRA